MPPNNPSITRGMIGEILPGLNEGILGEVLFEPLFLLPPPSFFNRLLNTSSISGGDYS